jgi:uncharacterized protein (DUF1697 family)
MTVWIALLRAVNLGVRNKVPMALLRELEERDDVRVLDREVYVDYRDRFHGNSLSAAMVARRLGRHGTERNWATITKILELAAVDPELPQ